MFEASERRKAFRCRQFLDIGGPMSSTAASSASSAASIERMFEFYFAGQTEFAVNRVVLPTGW